MVKTNPIFEKHYGDYLQQLSDVDLARCAPVLGITVDEEGQTAEIPFFNALYRVSRFGLVDDKDRRPDYGICVVLLKYLLMCPPGVPPEKDWVTYRDFKDAGQSQNVGLSAFAAKSIVKRYTGRLERLRAAAGSLGGRRPETEFPYDLAAVFTALPRLPILFLFNDADEQFPAQASILYERRADHFLDAECRIMVDWYLLAHLKGSET
jgi:hypothetical protein